jgi:WD40 repeat protein
MPTCPFAKESERLGRLLADDLPEDEQSRLTAHVEECPECRRILDALAARSGLWKELPLMRDDLLDPPTIDAPSELGTEADDEEEIPLGLLEPADGEGQLGRLGQYDILDVLGRGGMGVVFRGRDRALDRLVAIKVLAPGLGASAAARRRFAREAKAAAAVVHDHVVTIHAVDATPQGIPYIVMQYIAGKSVQDLIDRGKPPELREILRIGTQAAQALAAAHAQGLIHRDVKPANILLENGVERVKITDFGLARGVDDATMTQSGVVAGTPRYMSPEQARGEPIDHRSDLFSLGSVLYALCTGRAPFEGNSSIATLKRVCERTPQPIGHLNPDIPSWLVRIIERLHAKNPAERYSSAAEVADLLGRCLAHVQQPASVPLPVELSPPTRRRTVAAWGSVVACVILVGMLCFSGVRAVAQQAVDYVATVLRLKTPEGVLVIEAADPAVAVRLDGSELEITGAGVKELRLAVGPHHLQAVKDSKVLREELVTVTRGGRTVVSVRREPDVQPPATAASPTPLTPHESVTEMALRLLRAGGAHGQGALSMEPTPILRPGPPRRPGEYDTSAPRPAAMLQQLSAEVRSVAFSPDGKTIAYGLTDGRIGLWDWQPLLAGQPARQVLFAAHPGGVESVAFSPDGKSLASGGWDYRVVLWDVATDPSSPTLRWKFMGHTDGVRSVAFGAFGRLLVVGSFDGVVSVLSAGTGQRVWTSPKLDQPINGVQFSPSGHELAFAMGDYSKGTPGDPVGQPGEVQLWSWPGRKRIATMRGWTRECKSIAFHPEGGLFAVTGGDGTTRLYTYDGDSCKEKAVLRSGAFTAGVAFRPDGRLLATSNWSGEVLLWDPASQQTRAVFQAHGENIPCLAFSPDGQYLVTASADGSIKVWDVGEPGTSLGGSQSEASSQARLLADALKRNPPRPTLIIGDPTRLFMRDLVEGRNYLIAEEPIPGLTSCGSPQWSHDGRRIAFDASPGPDWQRTQLMVVEARDGKPEFTRLGPGNCPSFSPDDSQIAFLLNPDAVPGSESGIWIMQSDGTLRRRTQAEFGVPFWSPDGREILVDGFAEPTRSTVLDIKTGTWKTVSIPGYQIFSWPRWVSPGVLVASIGKGDKAEAIALLKLDGSHKATSVGILWQRTAALDVYPRWPLYSASSDLCYFVGVQPNKRTLFSVSRVGPGRAVPVEGDGQDDKLGGLALSPDGRYLLFCASGAELR